MPDVSPAPEYLENRTFADLAIGETASLSHTVEQRDIDLFATVTGDVNPAHVNPAYAATDLFHHIIIQGMWGAGLISATLGTRLPGPGTIYLGQDLRFHRPVSIGDTITATVTVTEKKAPKGDVTLDTVCTNQHGEQVITGSAFARAPNEKLRLLRTVLPEVRVARHNYLQSLIVQASAGAPVPTAVVWPMEAASLNAALAAAAAGLITPILIGPAARLKAVAQEAAADLAGHRIVDAADPSAAASRAVALVSAGEAALLMKGDLHTDDFMRPVVAAGSGLRTARRISHVCVLDVPGQVRPLLLTDVAINMTPDLMDKADIVRNAIDFAQIIGIAQPRVAILCAVETVRADMPSTIHAAALCKMADRGQIVGGLLDGPLAFDNAVDAAAAAIKGIVSPVAGRADILVVPDLEAGNMLLKQLTFLSGAEAGELVLGARVPIILSSRADSAMTRLASCAVAVLVARGRS